MLDQLRVCVFVFKWAHIFICSWDISRRKGTERNGGQGKGKTYFSLYINFHIQILVQKILSEIYIRTLRDYL